MTPNLNLLRILGAVAEAEEQHRSILTVAGMDAIDLMHFLAVAEGLELIEPVNSAAQYRLTIKGLETAATHMQPLSALFRAVTDGVTHHDRDGASEDRGLPAAHSEQRRDACVG